LASSRTHTLTYTIASRCVSEQKRKVYLEMLKNDRMRPLRDTIAVCYKHAEALHINQIFGIEANGSWWYPLEMEDYISKSTSPIHSGAVVMNGKGIYEDNSILLSSYHGVNAKTVKFTYTTDNSSCLKGKSYSVVIVLTEDITR
ncbi:MAG: hypothetical protein LBE04_07940, partial [Prevotellaceae bacterium]|nr:hypothetical protein [Prevotellaceae bacterium]